MTVSDMMKLYAIERVVFVPASDLVPRDSFHAWPFGAFDSDKHMGRGDTAEDAIADAARKMEGLAA